MRHVLFVVGCAVVLSVPGLTHAQSLAEVARAAEARNREATATQPAKVYTNKDLAKVPDAPVPAAAPEPAALPPSSAEIDAPASNDIPEQTERHWKARMRPLRAQLERDRTLAAASKARVDVLSVEADTCFRLGVVCAQYTDSLKEQAEYERLRGDVERDERAVRALEEEARRAGVPPGWLRP